MSIARIITFSALLSLAVPAFAGVSTKPTAQTVDQACTAEASAAGCGADQVGSGLKKCIGAYKKANKGFKLSPGCRSAIRADKGVN